jgi:hypothetical protein
VVVVVSGGAVVVVGSVEAGAAVVVVVGRGCVVVGDGRVVGVTGRVVAVGGAVGGAAMEVVVVRGGDRRARVGGGAEGSVAVVADTIVGSTVGSTTGTAAVVLLDVVAGRGLDVVVVVPVGGGGRTVVRADGCAGNVPSDANPRSTTTSDAAHPAAPAANANNNPANGCLTRPPPATVATLRRRNHSRAPWPSATGSTRARPAARRRAVPFGP